MYPPRIGDQFLKKLPNAEVIILDKNHEMIDKDFVAALSGLLL
jgi:hypothetical protein